MNTFEAEKSFVFKLSNTIKFSKDGKNEETASLEFRPPSIDVFREFTLLSEYFMQAALDTRKFFDANENTSNNEEKIDGKAVKALLFGSKEVNFKDVSEAFKNLAYKTGTTDGTTKIKPVTFDRLTINDFTNLVCEYIANFICPSLFYNS